MADPAERHGGSSFVECPRRCVDCDRPCYHEEPDGEYHHADDPSRGCFLIPAEDREPDPEHPLMAPPWVPAPFIWSNSIVTYGHPSAPCEGCEKDTTQVINALEAPGLVSLTGPLCSDCADGVIGLGIALTFGLT